MKIAVLGTGMVGNALATKLVQVGHQVMMGSRTADSEAGQKWLQSVDGKAQIGTFADAAAFGEMIISCTNGANSVAALRQAGEANLRAKVVIDVSNPLDMSQKPPTLTFCNTGSLGERIQREFPQAIRGQRTQHGKLRRDGQIRRSRLATTICSSAATTSRLKQKWRSSSQTISVGNARTLSTLATSPTRGEPKCIWRFGYGFGASLARRTLTFTSFAPNGSRLGRSARRRSDPQRPTLRSLDSQVRRKDLSAGARLRFTRAFPSSALPISDRCRSLRV